MRGARVLRPSFATALIVLGLWCVAAAAPAHADEASSGRRHARRAGTLAASGKCRQAVIEYDKAIAALHDPALLFNRAECQRKLGNTDAALADYRQFLVDLPDAPNRPAVEQRIAELAGPAPTPAVAAAAPSGGPSADAPGDATAASGGDRGSRSGGSGDVAANGAEPSGSSGAHAGSVPRDLRLTAEAPAAGPTDVPPGASLSRSVNTAAPSASADGSFTSRPWFWAAVAVVAVGVGIGTFVLLNREGTDIPQSNLGNYKF